ncbi:MAG: ribonuclease H-like domain-containing protein [Spirochaetaceae bacterium]|nr:ribonuclease H-like domain-containing protein [Spirochaetaceae bacterium]
MASLKGRLNLLRSMGLAKASEMAADQVQSPLPQAQQDLPSGWEQFAPHCHVSTICSSFALGSDFPPSFDARLFGRIANRDSYSATILDDMALEAMIPLESLSFFDLETTGLSGGTGTIAFLAGIGYFESGTFMVSQVFMDDFPGETDLLGLTLESLAKRPILVTYNGKAFDIPLMRTRCILNGMAIPPFRHFDLLHTSRRLWKATMDSCSLSALEAAVLDIERSDDVPGALIPGIWLEYVNSPPASVRRRQSLPKIRSVLAHNVQDLVSLARLMCRIMAIGEDPLHRGPDNRVDPRGLARMLLAGGREEEALSILEQAGGDGNQPALVMLARFYRRHGLASKYCESIGLMDDTTVESCVEKAKYFEHSEKDFAGALRYAEKALQIIDSQIARNCGQTNITTAQRKRDLILKRKARLERKTAVNGSADHSPGSA